LAKLTIEWGKLASPTVATGKGATEVTDLSNVRGVLEPSLRQFDRPILVYLESARSESKTDKDNIETTTLKDERVALPAKLFTAVKANADEMTQDHPYWKFFEGPARPRFMLFSSRGELIGKLDGKVSPSKLSDLMKRALHDEFAFSLDRWVKDYQKVLTGIDKLESLKKALDQKAERDTSTSAQREIAARREKLEAESSALIAEEKKLFDLKRKDAVAKN
jgi:hypothetical protein